MPVQRKGQTLPLNRNYKRKFIPGLSSMTWGIFKSNQIFRVMNTTVSFQCHDPTAPLHVIILSCAEHEEMVRNHFTMISEDRSSRMQETWLTCKIPQGKELSPESVQWLRQKGI